MSDFEIKILIAGISGFVGIGIGILGHLLTKRRDFRNKKREIRINYLIEAYRKIERGAMPKSILFDKGEFESAIADIQLIGNAEQVKVAFEFAKEASQGKGDRLQELLENLRNELREELKIGSDDLPKVRPFRMTK